MICLVQGAELMSKFGVNVPPGKPAFSLEDVKLATEAMADQDGQVPAPQLPLAVSKEPGTMLRMSFRHRPFTDRSAVLRHR